MKRRNSQFPWNTCLRKSKKFSWITAKVDAAVVLCSFYQSVPFVDEI